MDGVQLVKQTFIGVLTRAGCVERDCDLRFVCMPFPACSPAIDVWTREVWDKTKKKKKKKSFYKKAYSIGYFSGKKKGQTT